MLIVLASWVNRKQQVVIEYLRTENAVLKEKFGKKRILLTDDQRRRLAVKGKTLRRKAVQSFLEHDHTERNHQGLGNELIVPMDRPPDLDAEIEATERLGGLLRSYRRAA